MNEQRLDDQQLALLHQAFPVAGAGDVVRMTVTAPLAPGFKKDGKFLRGKNDRLFLDNDANEVVRQHTGERLFSPAELAQWRSTLETRLAGLAEMGIPYFFLVPPNAHAVYPEDLPDHVVPGRTRPILQLLDELRDSPFSGRLIYPLEEMLAAKPGLLYPKTDGHWSAVGAYVAYRRIAEELSAVVAMHVVEERDVFWRERTAVGDLGFKLDPEQASPHISARVREPTAYRVADNGVVNTGRVVVSECPGAPATTCMMLGDSYCGDLLPFFAASFGRFVYAYTVGMDHDFIREHKPDVVLSVVNERFMIMARPDSFWPSVAEMEREKIVNGLVHGPYPLSPSRP